jgi:[acyl-carrier-protein] S-malonyltransferase
MKIALVFPGQASQAVGMGKDLAERFPEALRVFEEADGVLGEDFRRLLWEGPPESLNLTANTQPAVLAVSAAAFRVLSAARPDLAPAFLAGHSLGEYSAHVAAGTLDFADALRTVRQRGLFMQEAVPVGEGAMAALMGMEAPEVEQVCREASPEGEVVPACAAACPAEAIVFGDLKDPESRVSKLARSDRAYKVLEELGVRPSVTYLAQLRNVPEDTE